MNLSRGHKDISSRYKSNHLHTCHFKANLLLHQWATNALHVYINTFFQMAPLTRPPDRPIARPPAHRPPAHPSTQPTDVVF